MLFLNRSFAIQNYIVAVFVAIAVPMGLGYLIYVENPSACYDSPCLLPLLLIIVPPYASPLLAALFAINRRRKKIVLDGWLPTVLFSGFVGHIAISVFAVSMSPPYLRDIFFSDLLAFPEGMIVGLVIGAVFWVALVTFARKGTTIGRKSEKSLDA